MRTTWETKPSSGTATRSQRASAGLARKLPRTLNGPPCPNTHASKLCTRDCTSGNLPAHHVRAKATQQDCDAQPAGQRRPRTGTAAGTKLASVPKHAREQALYQGQHERQLAHPCRLLQQRQCKAGMGGDVCCHSLPRVFMSWQPCPNGAGCVSQRDKCGLQRHPCCHCLPCAFTIGNLGGS